MGKWTDQGFVANQKSYYKAAIQQIFVDAFGSDFDLNDNLPQGVLIERLAELFYGIDMDGVEAFARLNLNTMAGVFLDVVGSWRGIARVLGEPQTGVVTVTCRAENFTPFSIPEGTVLTCTESGDRFVTTRLATFSSETLNVEIAYTENGNSNAIVGNTMTTENFPMVQNIEIISLFDGTENESDMDYRSRLEKEYPASTGTIEYVNNLLRALPTVKAVNCLYNDSTTTVDTIPAYCTEWIVAPKSDVPSTALDVFKQTVAEIVLDNKVPGAPTHGNTTMTLADVFGTPKTVKFTIAYKIPIEIHVTAATPESTGIFDLGNQEEIKAVAAAYINNLDVGKDVSYSRCIAPFAADTGFDVTSFKMRRVGNLTGADTLTYLRNPLYDTEDALAWRVGNDFTPYYTEGLTFPAIPTDPSEHIYIYSDPECETQVTMITAVNTNPWLENSNLLITSREYASITTDDITIGI
jgi:uncharacterized phage protein gp47/JayE